MHDCFNQFPLSYNSTENIDLRQRIQGVKSRYSLFVQGFESEQSVLKIVCVIIQFTLHFIYIVQTIFFSFFLDLHFIDIQSALQICLTRMYLSVTLSPAFELKPDPERCDYHRR